MNARRVDRPGESPGSGYGYEIVDGETVVETGRIALRSPGASFAAWPDGAHRWRPGSVHAASDGVLAWLAEHGPEQSR